MEIEQNKQEDELHMGLVRISIPLILDVLKIPGDYQMRGAYVNARTNCIDIVVEHDSLPVVDEATPIPEVMLTYTREDPLPHLDDVKLTDIKVSEV